MICDNAMLFNFPKSHIHIEAKKLKILGVYAFKYFNDYLATIFDSSKPVNLEEMKKIETAFLDDVDLHYFDILFSMETDPNSNNIRILQRPKPNYRRGVELIQNQQNISNEKEIIIEITGMNHILESKVIANDQ